MRIAIDGRSMQDKLWTGVGHYTYNLLRAIFELDKENEYAVWYNACGKLDAPLFAEYDNVQIYRTNWPNKLLNLSIKVLGRPLFPPLRLRGGQEGLRTAHNSPQPSLTLREGAPVDLLFLPNLNFIALAPNTKLVIAAHDLSYEHFPEFFSRKSRLWHRIINPRALFSRADQIITVSEHTQGDLTETYNIPQEKITVIYPGVNFFTNRHCEEQGDEAISEIATLPMVARNDTNDYILYFGALEPRKNIEGIIAAYELLKNPPNLVLAGCSSSYVAKLKKKIKNNKCRDKIRLVENPDEQNKKELYTGAELFIYPSFYEGFGFPPLEAMSAGVPVVASSASSVPEICADAAVLVNPFNVQEIKQGMEILLKDYELREKYIQAGYARVKQFSWTNCAEQVIKVFQEQ